MRSILPESFLRMTGTPYKTALMPSPAQRNKTDLDIVETTTSTTASHRFLFSNFRYSFTLFSKFFSSFPHGTCSLSVSHPYLALDGIYHPFELQSQTTRLMDSIVITSFCKYERGYHPPRRVIPDHFIYRDQRTILSADYISEDFQSELFPLHSPLLGKSLLVSFPPLSYMLKFSGYSYLIGGLM